MVQKINERLILITQMLLKMAVGNYAFQIASGEEDCELNVILEMVYLALDELRESLHKRQPGIKKPDLQFIIHVTFLLDKTYCVEAVVADGTLLPHFLQISEGTSFINLLDFTSREEWNQACKKIETKKHHYIALVLNFKLKETPKKCFCTISNMSLSEKTLVNIFSIASTDNDTSFQSMLDEVEDSTSNVMGRKLHDYILSNLDTPLPTIKELVKIFGTNEFYLKDSFRRLFQTSIYKFYNNHRLKRAHLLVKETTLPLWEIAEACGFGSYNNFCKAFRKRFGCSANSLRRNRY